MYKDSTVWHYMRRVFLLENQQNKEFDKVRTTLELIVVIRIAC